MKQSTDGRKKGKATKKDEKTADKKADSKKSKKKEKEKKRKKPDPPSSESSESSDSSSNSGSCSDDSDDTEPSDSSDDSSDSDDHSSARRTRKRKRKGRKFSKGDWELLNIAWPIEERPEHLRKRENLRGRDLDSLMRLKREMEKVEEKKELGDEVFTRDATLKKTKYKAKSDDGFKKLHPARGCRQPLSVPSEWYGELIPKKREQVVRNFPVEHYGMAGQVSEKVIGKAHNRSVPLTFDQFSKNSFADNTKNDKPPDLSVQQLQETVLNFAVVLHALWPSDYTAFAVFRVLIEAKWGDVAGNDNRYLFVLFVPSAFLLSLVEWQYVATPDAHRFLKKLG
jgi:hypothetical protein